MKLFGDKSSASVVKVLITSEYAGVKVDVPALPADKLRAKSCLGILPVLEVVGGGCCCGGNVASRTIARMRPESALMGNGCAQEASVECWMNASAEKLEVPVGAWLLSAPDGLQPNPLVATCAEGDVKTFLGVLNKFLLSRTYLVGEGVTVADIAIAVTLTEARTVLPADFMNAYPNVARWLSTVSNQSKVKKHLVALPKSGKAEAEAPKPVAAPMAAAPPKRSTNPLDDLPPSKFVMDEWKREYSNTKDLYSTMPWFWEHFDAEGYSIWSMKYEKLEGECEVAFVTSNQLGGFLQRVDPAFRKYSFAVNNVVGIEKEFDIQGVWLFRGQEVPFEMKDHPSYEYHTFTKLDHSKEDVKKLIADYWCNDDVVEGRPIADGKVWK